MDDDVIKIFRPRMGLTPNWFMVPRERVDYLMKTRGRKYFDENLSIEENLEENSILAIIIFQDCVKRGVIPSCFEELILTQTKDAA